MSASLCVLQLARAALAGVEGLTGVFDAPPPDAAPPYAVIGAGLATDWSHKNGTGHDHRLSVAVWTAGPGTAAARALAGVVEAALATLSGSAAGHRIVAARPMRCLVLAEPGDWSRAIVDVRVLTEQL